MKKAYSYSIMYLSTALPEFYIQKNFKNIKRNIHVAAQKYNKLLCEGLADNNIEISHLSIYADRYNSQIINHSIKNIEKGVYYIFYQIKHIKHIKNIIVISITLFELIKFIMKNKREAKKSIIICDILNISLSAVALLISKLFRISNIAIVTDVPKYLWQNEGRRKIIDELRREIIIFIDNYIISKYDSYVFLTTFMDKKINNKRKPYVIIDGLVDHKLKIDNIRKNQNKEKFIMYAGGLNYKYGIEELIEAFIKFQKIYNDIELHIYGDGPLRNYVEKKCMIYKSIKYYGKKENNEIISREKAAMLLVNPRGPDQIFTKYSFPSKNLEYMASGTPLLACILPGMSKTYGKYIYYMKNNSEVEIYNALLKIFSTSIQDRENLGKAAQNYVFTFKNKKVQALKIINLIDGLE